MRTLLTLGTPFGRVLGSSGIIKLLCGSCDNSNPGGAANYSINDPGSHVHVLVLHIQTKSYTCVSQTPARVLTDLFSYSRGTCASHSYLEPYIWYPSIRNISVACTDITTRIPTTIHDTEVHLLQYISFPSMFTSAHRS